MKRFSFWRTAVSALLAGAVACHSSHSFGEEREDVLRAWQQREGEVDSFRFACQVNEVVHKLTRTQLDRDNPRKNILVPAQDTLLGREFTYFRKEEKALYIENGASWHNSRGEARMRRLSENWDGDDARRLYQEEREPAQGFVYVDGAQLRGRDIRESIPVLTFTLIYRPLTDFLKADPANINLIAIRQSKSNPAPQGITSVILPTPIPDMSFYVWADPDRNYLPIRWFYEQSGALVRDESIEYRAENGVWVPARFRSQYFSRGRLASVTDITVTNSSINASLDDELFEIEFPIGTEVTEFEDDSTKTYVVSEIERSTDAAIECSR